MKSHLRALLIVLCIPLAAACDDYQYRFFGAAPTPVRPRPLFNSPFGMWSADGTIVSISGGRGCGVGFVSGETRTGVSWRITSNIAAILIEQDLQNSPVTALSPFSGSLTGLDFKTSASSNGNPLQSSCLFRGGTLTGTFSADFSTFDATEDLLWGQPGAEVHVQRHWVGSRQS